MNHRKLSYQRPKQLEVRSRQVQFFLLEAQARDCSNTAITSSLPSNYKRSSNHLSDVRLYIILAGGEKRERQYFSHLYEIMPKGIALPLFIICPTGRRSGRCKSSHLGSSPQDMLTFWDQVFDVSDGTLIVAGRPVEVMPNDRIFFVSDVDEYGKELEICLRTPLCSNVRWAISNPCFETWLYYSFCGQPSSDLLERLLSQPLPVRSKYLKRLCNEVIAGGMDARKAPRYMRRALEASKSYGYEEDDKLLPKLFCSGVMHFAEDFLDYIHTNRLE